MLRLGFILICLFSLISCGVEVHQEFVTTQRVGIRFKILTDMPDEPRPPRIINLFPRATKTNLVILDAFNSSFNFTIQMFDPHTKEALGNWMYRQVHFIDTNQPWMNDTFTTASGISLSVATKISCARHYFGNRCDTFCDGHLAKAARKRCDGMGRLRCDIGWMGPHCGQSVDPRKCSCQNDGICASSAIHHNEKSRALAVPVNQTIEQLICECTNGFTGNRCEIPGFSQFQLTAPRPDACSVKDACLNGAKCFPNGPKAFCSCAVGFIGEFCEFSLTTTTPTIEITATTSEYSYAIYIVVGLVVVTCIAIGCFTYKRKPKREHALARGQAPEPYVMPETKLKLIDPEACLPKKVFTIEDSVKKIDEEERYTSAPNANVFNNEYAVIQKTQQPQAPTSCLPPVPNFSYV